MRDITYKVIEEFDEKKDYGKTIQKRFIPGIKVFKKNQVFKPKDLIKDFMKTSHTKMEMLN